jgi:hypothetical protein
MEVDINKRYQTMLTLWAALLLSLGSYFVFSLIAAPSMGNAPSTPGNSLLTTALTGLGTILALLSFPVKRRMLERSVETQDVALVQKGMIVACALCEVAAVLGLIERLVIGSRNYYLLFVIATIGILLHFPRRDQLLAASYKKKLE